MRRLFLAIALTITFFGTPSRAAEIDIDLELVLLVDTSNSMSPFEQDLQFWGYVQAFAHPGIARAIRSGLRGKIVVTFVTFSDVNIQKVLVPWTLIEGSDESTKAFALMLANKAPLRNSYGGTSISKALEFSTRLFYGNGFAGTRQVIDISGDGPNSYDPVVTTARDLTVAKGITINGLPIMLYPDNAFTNDPHTNIDTYYEDCVIGGPGAFIVRVKDEGQFAESILRKLLLEIAGREPTIIPANGLNDLGAPTRPKADCQIGVLKWKDFYKR